MVVNSAMDTKGFSRVATFAKATAAEEHVERVDCAACKSKRGFAEVNVGLRH